MLYIDRKLYLFQSMVDPDMDKQIEVIKMMVESYLKIVGKTIRDIAPKYIMLLLVLHVGYKHEFYQKASF